MTRAVVIGSGPNGLSAALVLARAGVDVTLYEAAATLGGGTRSGEYTLPGIIHDECSAFHPFAVSSPFAAMAHLEDYGLRWGWPRKQYAHPLDKGLGAAVDRSLEVTARELG